MSYLKALGVFRLVTEQADAEARAFWKEDVFHLLSKLDKAAIVNFLLNSYSPSPLLAPWGARSGFYRGASEKTARFALKKIGQQKDRRFNRFNSAVSEIRGLLDRLGISDKVRDDQKLNLLDKCRANLSDELLQWLDSCYVLTSNGRKFPPLFGTGGNEGSGSYVSGFAQQIVACLIQREYDDALDSALFGSIRRAVISSQTPGHFSPQASGGANAGQGFSVGPSTNPWDYLLAIEGACLWTCGVTRKLGRVGRQMAAFPFTVNVSQAGAAALTGRDERKPKNAKRDIAELWLPLWDRHLGLQELSLLLSEGRVSLGTRAAETGVDFARAASSFGLDRGITEFQRTAFLMRNGQNFMSIPLGRFSVSDTRDSDLLNEIDGWLLRFRRACNEKAPARLAQALLRLEQAIFDFCRYGGPTRFAEILCALGEAEKRLAIAEGWRTEKRIRPLGGLSPQWITAANDNSLEFELALALAGIHDPQFKVGPLRTNLEPVSTDGYKGRYAQIKWAENGRSVVWNSADLCVNLAAVLDRRLMDGKREGCANLPLAFQHAVSLESIAAFLYGAVNRKKLAELLWGIILIDRNGSYPHFPSARVNGTVVLPRAYALLKLLFLPRPIMIPSNPEGTRETRFTRIGESGIRILPEACVLSLLRAGRVNEACAIASRRLHSSGLAPILVEWEDLGSINGLGLASALLIPITEAHIGTLLGIVTRPTQHPICSPEVERR